MQCEYCAALHANPSGFQPKGYDFTLPGPNEHMHISGPPLFSTCDCLKHSWFPTPPPLFLPTSALEIAQKNKGEKQVSQKRRGVEFVGGWTMAPWLQDGWAAEVRDYPLSPSTLWEQGSFVPAAWCRLAMKVREGCKTRPAK